jgi:FixJ family two-component response regulator
MQTSSNTAEARLAAGTELAGLGYYEVDYGKRTCFLDDRFREICGIPPDQQQSWQSLEFWMEHVHPSDLQPLLDERQRLHEGSLDRISAEYRFLHPAQGEKWIHHLARIVERSASGAQVRTFGVIRDITQQKRAEAELLRQRTELAHIARVSTMGELAASLAHEVNQPLGAILANAETAEYLLEQDTLALDEMRAVVAAIRKDGERAGEVIRRIRALFAKHKLELHPLDLNSVVQDVGQLVSRDAALRGVSLSVALTPGLPEISGDRTHLQQVVLNLIVNGMDALAPAAPEAANHGEHCPKHRQLRGAGSDRLRPWHRAGHPAARLRALLHHQTQRHGHGPFDCPHHYRSASRPHLGREQHLGRRDVPHRAAGQRRGPVGEAQLRVPPAALNPIGSTMKAHPSAPAPRPTVFVVDDDLSFRQAIERLVRTGGYAVHTFASATEFLQFTRPDVPGCVVLDLDMPGLSGLDLQSALVGVHNPLPIVFLTGKGSIPTTVQAMRAGAEDFLTKPTSKKVLFAAIERALARHAQGREQQARRRELLGRFDALTPREREVLTHVLSGRLNKQIAAELNASERTIKMHRANLMAKLQVQSVAELARLAHEAGFPATQ